MWKIISWHRKQASQGRCPTGLTVCEQRRTSGRCDGWRPWNDSFQFGVKLRGMPAELDLQQLDFGLFRRLIIRDTSESVLKVQGVQEDWTWSKKEILKVQEQ